MRRDELVRYLDRFLRIDAIPDYGPQGLQVEGAGEIHAHADAGHDESLAAQRRSGSRADRGDIFDDEHPIGHAPILHKLGTRIRRFAEIRLSLLG